MSQLARLEDQIAELRRKAKRQRRLFESTHRRGHARRVRQLERKIDVVEDAIGKLQEDGPSWKLDYAARFVAPFEGLRLETYLDSGGIPTIGYGHTGKEAFFGNVISPAKAMRLFVTDLRGFAREVNDLVTEPMSLRQRIAAISFAYNIGIGGFKESTFLREFNAGNTRAAANALLLWVRDENGTVLAGLERRRRAERWLVLHPRKGEKV